MRCDSCGSGDSVFYVRPDGHGGEERLCRACARERGYVAEGDAYGARLDALAGGLFDLGASPAADIAALACPSCSWTEERLRATGLLGCSECARALRRTVESTLRRSGWPGRYEGKVPPIPGARSRHRGDEPGTQPAMEELAAALERAIAAEDFESAAEFRDRLRLGSRGSQA